MAASSSLQSSMNVERACGKERGYRRFLNKGSMPRAYTIPSSNAFSTARVRSRTPSLERMFDTWFLTVPSATPSELAISLLL